MDIGEYVKYVLTKMHRASAANALNICKKFQEEYNFSDFVECLISYIEYNLLKLNRDGYSDDKMYKILALSYDILFKYNNKEIHYNKQILIDSYILSLWSIITGDNNYGV